MNLTPAQREGLARFLARRLPSWEHRAAVARASGLPTAQISGEPASGWKTLLAEALEADRLVALLEAAAAQAPSDPALAAVAVGAASGHLRLPRGPLWGVAIGLGAVSLLAAAGFAAIGLGTSVGEGSRADAPAPPVAVRPQVAAAPPAAAAAPPEAVTAPPEAVAAPSEAVTAPPPPVESTAALPEPAPVESAPALAEPAPAPRRAGAAPLCPGRDGEVVGYAFVGMVEPVFEGGVWVLESGRNVRSVLPSRANGFDTRSSVVCVLPAGARVRIGGAPIPVNGGAWWVPVPAGAASRP